MRYYIIFDGIILEINQERPNKSQHSKLYILPILNEN